MVRCTTASIECEIEIDSEIEIDDEIEPGVTIPALSSYAPGNSSRIISSNQPRGRNPVILPSSAPRS